MNESDVERVRQVVTAHHGKIAEQSENKDKLRLEFRADTAIDAFGKLTLSGFAVELIGYERRLMPAFRIDPNNIRRAAPSYNINVKGQLVEQPLEQVSVAIYEVSRK